MGEPVGAIKTAGHGEGEFYWILTDDVNAVFSTPEEDVIYAEGPDELQAELDLRYPAPDPRLKMYRQEWKGFRTLAYPMYEGDDSQEVAALAELCGKIFAARAHNNSAEWLANPKFAAMCVLDGCIVTYDPKKAKRRASSRAKTAARKYVSVVDTQRLVNDLVMLIRPVPDFKADPTMPRVDAVQRLVSTILVLNAIRGENAHRLVPSFQEYAKEWRDRRPQTEAEWLKVEKLKPFVEWMGRECVVEFPEPIDTTAWKEPVDLLARLTETTAVSQGAKEEFDG